MESGGRVGAGSSVFASPFLWIPAFSEGKSNWEGGISSFYMFWAPCPFFPTLVSSPVLFIFVLSGFPLLDLEGGPDLPQQSILLPVPFLAAPCPLLPRILPLPLFLAQQIILFFFHCDSYLIESSLCLASWKPKRLQFCLVHFLRQDVSWAYSIHHTQWSKHF